jgi:hypothetical protein
MFLPVLILPLLIVLFGMLVIGKDLSFIVGFADTNLLAYNKRSFFSYNPVDDSWYSSFKNGVTLKSVKSIV